MNTKSGIIVLIGLIYATAATTIPNAYIQDITKAKVTGATIYTSYAELQIEVPLKVSPGKKFFGASKEQYLTLLVGRTEILLTNLPSNTMYDGTFRVSAKQSQVTSVSFRSDLYTHLLLT